jgi:hypothetical protein
MRHKYRTTFDKIIKKYIFFFKNFYLILPKLYIMHNFLLKLPSKETYLKLKEIAKKQSPATTVGGLINHILKTYLNEN